MLEIKVTVDIPSLVEAAKILAARQPEPVKTEEPKAAPMPAAAPVAAPVAPVAHAAPVAAPAGPTRAAVATAGAQLLSQQPGLQTQLVALLGKYGAQTVQDVPEEQLGAFADDLRGLGARI